jgi:hypothetical protein
MEVGIASLSATPQPSWTTGTNGALWFLCGVILVALLFGYITEETFRGTLTRGGG